MYGKTCSCYCSPEILLEDLAQHGVTVKKKAGLLNKNRAFVSLRQSFLLFLIHLPSVLLPSVL